MHFCLSFVAVILQGMIGLLNPTRYVDLYFR